MNRVAVNYLGVWVIRTVTSGPTSWYKKTLSFLASFPIDFSITFLGLTSTGIFELELAVLEWLPTWRRICCVIYVIFFLSFFLLLSITELLFFFRSIQYSQIEFISISKYCPVEWLL